MLGADFRSASGRGMHSISTHEVTGLLRAWSAGDRGALEQLIPLVYGELHRLAHLRMRREKAGHTLQTTGLIHEAYVRLAGGDSIRWENRTHFFAIASRLMRQILVEHARALRSRKRGGGVPRVALDEARLLPPQPGPDLVTLDDALNALSRQDPRKGRIVELRFFGGLSVDETARVLEVSPQTVMRDWKLARVWLYREMRRGTDGPA